MRKVMYQLNSLSEPMPGYFHGWAGTMQDAAKAYNQMALKLHGEFAKLNIIE